MCLIDAVKVKRYGKVFAFESTGGMSVEARALMMQIALASNDLLRLEPAGASWSVAIQRVNALRTLAGMSKTLRAGGWAEEE